MEFVFIQLIMILFAEYRLIYNESFAILGKLINCLHDFLHLCTFILQLQEFCYQRTLTCINNKMKEKCTEGLWRVKN
jgi:hypothetical protein